MSLNQILGKNIKYFRYKQNITQEKLAELLEVSANYIGRLERGQHNPSLNKIEKISTALKIKPYELFMENENAKNLPSRVNLSNFKN